MKSPCLLVPFLGLSLASAVYAGDPPVDVTAHFPLGVFNAWRLVQEDDELDTSFIKVTNVVLKDGVLRYTVATPFFDELEQVKLVMGVDDGTWYLYRAGFSTDQVDDLEADLMTFEPPVVLGTTTETLGTQHSTVIDTILELKLEAGPIKKTVDVAVTGTIDSRFEASFDGLDTPAGSFDASELLDWFLDFDLAYESLDDDIDFDGDVQIFGLMQIAEGLGYVRGTDPNSSFHVLDAAILPGQTIGGDFQAPGTVLRGLAAPTPGLFTLHGQAASESTGGAFVLSDVQLTHLLGGKLLLEGLLASTEEGGESIPFAMTGSCKISKKTGLAKLTLKGKTKMLTEKPLLLSAKQDVTPDTTEIVIAYKSGKDILGEMSLGITPFVASGMELAFNTLVDTGFKLSPKKRTLGAEGVLTLLGAGGGDGEGTVDFPVTLVEKRKIKEGQADKHGYKLMQTGLKAKVLSGSAFSTMSADFLLTKFSTKLHGLPIQPESIEDVLVQTEDA